MADPPVQGSVEHPISLDPWHRVVAVHWDTVVPVVIELSGVGGAPGQTRMNFLGDGSSIGPKDVELEVPITKAAYKDPFAFLTNPAHGDNVADFTTQDSGYWNLPSSINVFMPRSYVPAGGRVRSYLMNLEKTTMSRVDLVVPYTVFFKWNGSFSRHDPELNMDYVSGFAIHPYALTLKATRYIPGTVFVAHADGTITAHTDLTLAVDAVPRWSFTTEVLVTDPTAVRIPNSFSSLVGKTINKNGII